MKKTSIACLTVAVAASSLSVGCISRTKYQDEPRQSVRFESPEAARLFYDTHLAVMYPKRAEWNIDIMVPLPYSQKTQSTEAKLFNTAVEKADQVPDHLITEAEARRFAAAYGPTAETGPVDGAEEPREE